MREEWVIISIIALLIAISMHGCTTVAQEALSCKRTCPVGLTLGPSEYEKEHAKVVDIIRLVNEDCCNDSNDQTWSSCAWSMKVLQERVQLQSR